MDTVITAMTTEMTTITETLVAALATIAPIALPLLGIGLAVTVGINFYKKISKNAAR